jgi:hypothetical protein
MKYEITGVVLEKESGAPVRGLLVRGYDKDLIYDDLLGTAITDEEGRFTMAYTERDFSELFEKRPDIYLEVYAAPMRFLASTKDAIRWGAATDERFVIEIDRDTLGDAAPGLPDDVVEGCLSLRRDDLDIVTTPEGMAVPRLKGFANAGAPGRPLVPTKLQFVALPLAGDVLDLEVDPGEPVILPAAAPPYPAQEVQPDVGTNPEEFGDGVSIDTIVYGYTPLDPAYAKSEALHPAELVTVEKTETLGLFDMVALRVNPVQYDPAARAYRFYPDLRYKVTFDREKARKQAEGRQRRVIGAIAAEQAQAVLQYADVMVARDIAWGDWVIIPEETPHLIITDNFQWPESVELEDGTTRPPTLGERGAALAGDMVAAFEKLAEWKTARGVRSRVVTVSDIVSGVHGNFHEDGFTRDLAEVIRNFIKFVYEKWDTRYVLLAGDLSVVPMRRLTGCNTYKTVGCGRVSDNPPPEMKAHALPADGVVKLHPLFTPQPGDPLASYHGGLRIPFDREAGPARLGWYYTTEDSFNTMDSGFTRLDIGQTSRYVIVEGPASVIDDDYYWVRDVNSIPSDMYYASLFGSGYSVAGKHDFDFNNNGLYGQYHSDNGHKTLDRVDDWSDVWVGRASVDSSSQAEAFVDKVITYERLETPDEDPAPVDATYIEKIIYAAAVWGRLHYGEQGDTSTPPGKRRFTHEAGTTTTKLHLDRDVALNAGVPDYRIVANTAAAQIIIPYKTNASGTNLGWFFTTADDYATQSATATRFVKIRGPEASIDPDDFYLDPVGLEGSVIEKEAMRAVMDTQYPDFNQIQRHYEDHFDLSPPPPLQPLESSDLMDAINAGVHFLSLTGHGWSGGCCGVSSGGDSFTNDNRFFVAFADSCSTGRPDGTDSLAEKAIFDPDGGGVGYVGNSRYSWIGVGDNYERFFWQAVNCFGRMGPAAGVRLAVDGERNMWTMYAQNLFGDPEMPVWTSTPRSADVIHSATVTAGAQFAVSVLKSGLPASGHKVTIMGGWSGSGKRPRILESKTTAATGIVTFTIPEGSGPNTLQVTVTKRNYKPYVGHANVVAPIVADRREPAMA